MVHKQGKEVRKAAQNEALMDKNIGWMKAKIVNVLGMVRRFAMKMGLESLDDFELYWANS